MLEPAFGRMLNSKPVVLLPGKTVGFRSADAISDSRQ